MSSKAVKLQVFIRDVIKSGQVGEEGTHLISLQRGSIRMTVYLCAWMICYNCSPDKDLVGKCRKAKIFFFSLCWSDCFWWCVLASLVRSPFGVVHGFYADLTCAHCPWEVLPFKLFRNYSCLSCEPCPASLDVQGLLCSLRSNITFFVWVAKSSLRGKSEKCRKRNK